ncbi:MAG: hypothetical protein O3B01_01670 [Planctomycetota bacterium]|nr:hypothetical protein [Planctomycetota bacterium]MDA1137266.1 hypothetical protein [Planctomycetota bacterium]
MSFHRSLVEEEFKTFLAAENGSIKELWIDDCESLRERPAIAAGNGLEFKRAGEK